MCVQICYLPLTAYYAIPLETRTQSTRGCESTSFFAQGQTGQSNICWRRHRRPIHSWNCHFSIIITIINSTFKHFLYIIIISYSINNIEYKYIILTHAMANGPTYTRLVYLYYYYRKVYSTLGTIAASPFVRTIGRYVMLFISENRCKQSHCMCS